MSCITQTMDKNLSNCNSKIRKVGSLVQDCCISSVLALEIIQFCTMLLNDVIEPVWYKTIYHDNDISHYSAANTYWHIFHDWVTRVLAKLSLVTRWCLVIGVPGIQTCLLITSCLVKNGCRFGDLDIFKCILLAEYHNIVYQNNTFSNKLPPYNDPCHLCLLYKVKTQFWKVISTLIYNLLPRLTLKSLLFVFN